MNQPISKEMRASSVGATNFEVTITQEMSAKEGAEPHHSFALPHLSAAVTAFDLKQVPPELSYDPSENYFEEDEDSFVPDGDSDEEYDEFQLRLTYLVSYNVLVEMDNALPLPDDSEMVVRISYKSDEGTPLFYHEFRGIFQISYEVRGDRTLTGDQRLTMPLTMTCWGWSLFNLCNSLVRK